MQMVFRMKKFLLLTILLANTIVAYSKVKVEDAKTYRDFAYSVSTPAQACDFFVNAQQYGYDELIQLDDSETNEIEALINNPALKLRFIGRDLSTAKGMTIYMSMIVRIDSTDHFFIVRDRSVLTEILKGNVRKDYIFINEKQKMVLGNLAMKYSVSRKYGYKNPVELPVSIDRIICYSHSWKLVNAGNAVYFFENPDKIVKNSTMIQVEKQDVEMLEYMLNNASKVKKCWNRITVSSWERNRRNVLPVTITVDSLKHNFVLSPMGEIVELVDGGEVFYIFKDKQDKQYLADFVKRYNVEGE